MNAKEELIEFLAEIDKKPICANMCRGWRRSQAKELFLLRVGYSESDWQNFLGALDFEYKNGYGEQELLGTLWFDGSWAERAEYDGSEWWELRQYPEIPRELHPSA